MGLALRALTDVLLSLVSKIVYNISVLRSTAPAPLGVRKVHKIVYNGLGLG